MRRRQQQTTEWSSTQRIEGRPRGPAGTRPSGSFILRNLPVILGVQVLLLAFIVLDPLKLRIDRSPPPATNEGPNKPLLGIADVEELSKRVAINGTILVLVCPAGAVPFQPSHKLSEQNIPSIFCRAWEAPFAQNCADRAFPADLPFVCTAD